jgi:hypothetical protein
VSGTVHLTGAEGEKTATGPSSVDVGDAVSTAEGSAARLAMNGQVSVDLRERTQVELAPASGPARQLVLNLGRIRGSVDPSPSEAPKLSVRTPDAEFLVKGTIFDVHVARNAAGHTRSIVSVERGRVDVRQQGQTVATVRAGQRWQSANWPEEEEPEARKTEPENVEADPVDDRAQPTRPPLRQVRTPARTPDPTGTLAQENQLFQSAAIARNLGDDSATISHLRALVQAFPGSPLRQEARVELMRAYTRQGRAKAAARAAEQYLSEFPSGFARGEARQLASTWTALSEH